MACEGCDCKDGARGPQGIQGPQGETGPAGPAGPTGPQGNDGAVGANGVSGAVGATGAKGDTGVTGLQGTPGLPGGNGTNGTNGIDGATGPQGGKGDNGESAYDIWITEGNVGTEADFLLSLEGTDGVDGTGFTDQFLAKGEPGNINSISPALGSTELCDAAAVLQVITEEYDDGGRYDAVTGIWTVGTTGRYDMSFFVSLTNLSGFSNGIIKAGIAHPTTCDFECVNVTPIDNKTERAQVSGSAMGINLTAGQQLALKIINASSTNYVAVAGDTVQFSARKVG
jgi:hypothetical protein